MQQHGLLQKPTHGGVSVEGREKQQENYQSFTYCKNNEETIFANYRMQRTRVSALAKSRMQSRLPPPVDAHALLNPVFCELQLRVLNHDGK